VPAVVPVPAVVLVLAVVPVPAVVLVLAVVPVPVVVLVLAVVPVPAVSPGDVLIRTVPFPLLLSHISVSV
jgi:hypothetical protein